MGSHDEDASRAVSERPANRLGLDYRAAPPRRVPSRIVDVHSHVQDGPTTAAFFEAADCYHIDRIVTMTPIDQVAPLRARYGDRLAFIAVPRWRELGDSDAFRTGWLNDLDAFAGHGARRMKFWMAPPMRGRHGLKMQDAFFRPVLEKGLELGFDFMIHVGDPAEWFAPGAKYGNAATYGTRAEQYEQLEYLLEKVAPRNVIAAHMGGSIDDPDRLQALLDRYPHLYLDSSATKWIVRGVAQQPERLRAFFSQNADRILFGSDLVVGDSYDFEHYASRYWVHQTMYETAYRGESPIADPDASGPPRLAGLNLPDEVLVKLYDANAGRLGY